MSCTVGSSAPGHVERAQRGKLQALFDPAVELRGQWLRPGMHVTAVGADTPGKQELEAECLARADRVVVDRLAQCARFGELSHALAAGLMSEAGVWAQLGEIVAGRKAGRTGGDQITICDLTGVGFQDTAIAALAWNEARDR